VSEAADYTVKEAGKLTGIAKLKYKIATTNARLDTLFAKVGRLKYGEAKGDATDFGCLYCELFEQIDTLETDIRNFEDELAKLKNERLCVACRSVIGLDMAFCPRCGAKQPDHEPEEDCSCGCGCDASCDCGCQEPDATECCCEDDDCCCSTESCCEAEPEEDCGCGCGCDCNN